MRRTLIPVCLALLLGACAAPFPRATSEDVQLVPARGRIEVQLGADGAVRNVEFHIDPSALPASVRAAADREIPGGKIVGCEKEYVGGVAYWEVTKKVKGLEQEVLFNAAGRPLTWEVEIPASELPAAVRAAADRAAGGRLAKVERILDGARRLLEYHVKKHDQGIRYKIILSPDGRMKALYRETDAEIEVPIAR